MKQETIEDYKVTYKKFAFSKNIKISLRADKNVLVSMPLSCPYKTAKSFLISNFLKIKSFKIQNKYLTPDLTTKFETLKIIRSEKLQTKTIKNIVYFYYPAGVDFNCEDIQKPLKEAYLKALKIEAKNYLPQRIEYLAQKFGFKYNKLALKNQKTRFGSCSYFNNINLNINLMKYDFDCIDYVIIHELCHTKIKNHSAVFWSEVEKFCPRYKELRKKLKRGEG